MISQQELDAIIHHVEQQGLSEAVLAQLRNQYNDYHFTYCIDDDMDAYEPVIEKNGFNIYFVNTSDHCASLTRQLETASGLVFGEVLDGG